MRRIHLAIAGAAIALLLAAAPASADFIGAAQAYRVADARAEASYERTAWAEEWEDECERQTPWRFSCEIEVWDERLECWQYFEVETPIFGDRVHVAEVTRWYCRRS